MSDIEKHLRHLREVGGRSNLEAARAIEALRGEVARLKSQRDEYLQFWKNNVEACEAAEAERDRLKAALQPIKFTEAK